MERIEIDLYEINKNDKYSLPFYENFDFEKIAESLQKFNVKAEDEEALFEEARQAINNSERLDQEIRIYKFYNETIRHWDYEFRYEYLINFELY